MEGDWSAPPSTLPIHNSIPVSLNEEPANPYQHEHYSKLMFAMNPSTSESMGSFYKDSQSPTSNGPQISVRISYTACNLQNN